MKFPHLIRLSLLNKLLKTEVTEERTFFALTLITGVVSAMIAVFVHKATHFLTLYFGTGSTFTLRALLWGGASILISGFITTRFYPSTSGSGIPGVRVALAVFNGKMTFRATLAKLVTSILSLSSGMSMGREGPTVAVTAGIGSSLGEFFHLTKKRVKALVAIGAAGGLAAAFNTPIAAVVFTLEEVVGDLNAKLLGSIVISSVMAAVVATILRGDQATFTVVHYELQNPTELLFYLGVGLAAAFVGPMWVKSVLKLREINLKIFKGHKLTIIMVTFLIMAALSLYNTKVLGSGHETINEALLSIIFDWKVLLILFALKFFATTISYASGASGGLFMPTLYIGAMLGGLIGSLAELLFPNVAASTGAYALVGMGAFFAAVIRAPFTSILMIFEMTRDYKIILPVMIANIVAYALASRFHEGSIYESISEQDGVHLPKREDNEVLENLLVEDAMITNPITLNANLTVRDAAKEVRGNEISGYPVLKNGVLLGMVSTNDIGANYAKGNGEHTLENICTKKLITIYPDQSLLVAFHKLQKYQISRLAVVSRINDKRLVGIITAEDIVNQFGYHVQEESKEGLIERYEKELRTYEEVEEQKIKYKAELHKEILQKELSGISLKDK